MGDETSVKSATPILLVDTIEACLPFWQMVGFQPVMTVPEAEPFAFAILHCGAIEVMMQTRVSAATDVLSVAQAVSASVLYLRVESLAPILAAFAAAPVAVERRSTFYGTDEIFLKDPSGNIVGFAAPLPA